MEKVSIHESEPNATGRRKLAGPLNTSGVAINHYVLEPGERFSDSLHAHMDQEEVFIVVAGEATFETMDGDVTVGEDEVIRFAPGEFQSGKNDTDERVVAFTLGAPRDTEDVRVPLECSECGHDDKRVVVTGGREVLVCPNCGAESETTCPVCGQGDMRATIPENRGEAIGVCQTVVPSQ